MGLVVVLLGSGSAFGQFIIDPMRLDIEEAPGRMVKTISISNQSPNAVRQLDFRVADVVQDPCGAWVALETDDPNVDRSKLRSCASWIRVDKVTASLSPFGTASVNAVITIPPSAQGSYCAAVVAQTIMVPGDGRGYYTAVKLQMVIPVVIDVRGRPLPADIDLTGAGLKFRPAAPGRPASAATLTMLAIENKGEIVGRLLARVRIFQKWAGHWRRITEVQFPTIGIIPGAKLVLQQDVGRPLPSGEYRLEGYLMVNGQPKSDITKELQFKGDDRVSVFHSEAALDFDPTELVMTDIAAGLPRNTQIQVGNASDETLTVRLDVTLPDHLVSKQATDPNTGQTIRGEAYGCMSWIKVEPNEFQLSAYGRQNVLVRVEMPASAASLPSHYAIVNFHTKYGDGQEGGTAKELVCVQNKKMTGTAVLDSQSVTMSELIQGAKYLIVSRYQNIGSTNVRPHCRGAVFTTGANGQIAKRLDMDTEVYNKVGNMLPLETRYFSGVLDISDMAPGLYGFSVLVEGDNMQEVRTNRGFQITVENGVKTLNQVGIDKVGEAVKVPF